MFHRPIVSMLCKAWGLFGKPVEANAKSSTGIFPEEKVSVAMIEAILPASYQLACRLIPVRASHICVYLHTILGWLLINYLNQPYQTSSYACPRMTCSNI